MPITIFQSPKWHLQISCVSPKLNYYERINAANIHIWEARSRKCLAFLLKKWLDELITIITADLFSGRSTNGSSSNKSKHIIHCKKIRPVDLKQSSLSQSQRQNSQHEDCNVIKFKWEWESNSVHTWWLNGEWGVFSSLYLVKLQLI